MKRLFLIFVCVFAMMMIFSVNCFAAEIDTDDLVPDDAIIVASGDKLLPNHTYYVVWMPYGDAYVGSGYMCIEAVSVNNNVAASSAKFNTFSASTYSSVSAWYGQNNAIVNYVDGYDWEQSAFVFPVVDVTKLEYNKYYTVSMTIPDDGREYYLQSYEKDTYQGVVYTYEFCEHVYDNDDDYSCNVCGYNRPRPSVLTGLTGFSTFVIKILTEFAVAITKSPLLLLGVVGIPVTGLGVGILSRLFVQRV